MAWKRQACLGKIIRKYQKHLNYHYKFLAMLVMGKDPAITNFVFSLE